MIHTEIALRKEFQDIQIFFLSMLYNAYEMKVSLNVNSIAGFCLTYRLFLLYMLLHTNMFCTVKWITDFFLILGFLNLHLRQINMIQHFQIIYNLKKGRDFAFTYLELEGKFFCDVQQNWILRNVFYRIS